MGRGHGHALAERDESFASSPSACSGEGRRLALRDQRRRHRVLWKNACRGGQRPGCSGRAHEQCVVAAGRQLGVELRPATDEGPLERGVAGLTEVGSAGLDEEPTGVSLHHFAADPEATTAVAQVRGRQALGLEATRQQLADGRRGVDLQRLDVGAAAVPDAAPEQRPGRGARPAGRRRRAAPPREVVRQPGASILLVGRVAHALPVHRQGRPAAATSRSATRMCGIASPSRWIVPKRARRRPPATPPTPPRLTRRPCRPAGAAAWWPGDAPRRRRSRHQHQPAATATGLVLRAAVQALGASARVPAVDPGRCCCRRRRRTAASCSGARPAGAAGGRPCCSGRRRGRSGGSPSPTTKTAFTAPVLAGVSPSMPPSVSMVKLPCQRSDQSRARRCGRPGGSCVRDQLETAVAVDLVRAGGPRPRAAAGARHRRRRAAGRRAGHRPAGGRRHRGQSAMAQAPQLVAADSAPTRADEGTTHNSTSQPGTARGACGGSRRVQSVEQVFGKASLRHSRAVGATGRQGVAWRTRNQWADGVPTLSSVRVSRVYRARPPPCFKCVAGRPPPRPFACRATPEHPPNAALFDTPSR